MHHIFLGLGSNLGDRLSYIDEALNLIEDNGVKIIKKSTVYETESWGVSTDRLFLNLVCEIESDMAPFDLLRNLLSIEKKLGRERGNERYADRTIDIDVLFYDCLVLESKELTIPHPEIEKRRFVLVPLVEIAPDFIHPLLKTSLSEILEKCTDTCIVKRL